MLCASNDINTIILTFNSFINKIFIIYNSSTVIIVCIADIIINLLLLICINSKCMYVYILFQT